MSFPYESAVDPGSVNINPDKLAKVVERFRRQQLSGSFPGGQLVLRRQGKLVLNEAVGLARGFRSGESVSPAEVHSQTPFPVFSAGKPLAAIVIALLEDRGTLDVEAPIARIWPQFACNGKEELTTLDVLTHRSGTLMPDFVDSMHLWNNRESVQTALIETMPTFPRGTLAYHPHEFGWILSEIVQRVDGRNLPDFFAEEIGIPLNLPALRFGLAGREIESLAFSYWLGKKKAMVAGRNVAEDFEEQNSEQFFSGNNPAVSLVCDGASLAAFYDFLLVGGATPAGQQLISADIIKRYITRNAFSWDRSLNTPLAVGRGFVVGTTFPSSFGWWQTNHCYGHAGGFACLVFGDFSTKISVAIVTNGNRGMYDFFRRFVPLAQGLRMACKR